MRNVLVFVTSLVTTLAVGCSEKGSPLQPSAGESPSAAPSEERPAQRPLRDGAATVIRADLTAVRRATAAFHDPAVAEAAGYLFNEPCQQSAAGAMGIHAPNPALVRDGIIDPEKPEVLLYLPQEDGTLRLVGVEYMQLANVRNPTTGVIAPWRPTSPWPADHQLVTPTPALFGQTFQGPMAGHSATMPWHWDLHVWVWAHNPDGLFAPFNPTLRCSG